MKQKILCLGATGFIGQALLARIPRADFEIGIIIHKKRANLNHVTQLIGDILDLQSLTNAIKEFKPDIIINLVGIIKEYPPLVTYENIIYQGTNNLCKACKDNKIKKIIFLSAIGADISGATGYFVAKAKAESEIMNSGINWVIFRPSVIFGPNAGFSLELISLLNQLPFIPIIGSGNYLFQPVALATVIECIVQSLTNSEINNRLYELVGPDVLTFSQIILIFKKVIKSTKPIIHIPLFIIKLLVKLEKVKIPFPLTSDQLKMLQLGSTGSNRELTKDFKITNINFAADSHYPLY